MKKLNIFTPPPKNTQHNVHFALNVRKIKRTAVAFSLILCFSLTACSTTSTTSEYESTEGDSQSESKEEYITQMEFSDDNEFWTYAEKTYSITSIDEISAGNKKREIILIDGIVLGSEDENAITKKYTIGFRSEDGSYKCYSETFQPSWNNLMTDISIMDTLKQGDLIRICAFTPNGNYVDFDSMYGLKIIGYDENTVKSILHTSENSALTETQENQNEASAPSEPSKPVPFTLKYGKLLDANPDGGVDMNTLVIKAKIEPNLTNRMTITQNYQNIIQMLQKDDYTQYDSIQYWAIADMTDGSEGKVISFTVDKSCIEAITNGTIASGDTLEEYLTDLWILPSLQEN